VSARQASHLSVDFTRTQKWVVIIGITIDNILRLLGAIGMLAGVLWIAVLLTGGTETVSFMMTSSADWDPGLFAYILWFALWIGVCSALMVPTIWWRKSSGVAVATACLAVPWVTLSVLSLVRGISTSYWLPLIMLAKWTIVIVVAPLAVRMGLDRV